MPSIPADTRRKTWKAPQGVGGFEPVGRKIFLDEFMPNMAKKSWHEETTHAARIFVGFSVGDVPTYTVDDLISLVTESRKGKGRKPDASYIVQKGVYTSKFSGEVVTETGAQLIVIDMAGLSLDEWTSEMEDLAELICRSFQQEEVVLEIQQNGIIKATMGILP